MDYKTAQLAEEAAASDAIRAVCEKTAPEVLWEALEAKGIETTPGVIYQVLNKPKDPESSQGTAGTAAVITGLTPEDLAMLGGLAAKVGGVSNLIRILEVWHETPK